MKKYKLVFSVGCLLLFLFSQAQYKMDTVAAIVANKTNKETHLTKFLNKKKWAKLFPNRFHISPLADADFKGIPKKEFYSFAAFESAAKLFPLFLGEGSDSTQKRELAAFLANMAHETNGGSDEVPGGMNYWGLYYVQEKGFPNKRFDYADSNNKRWLPVSGKSYHGRGPLQLSWNYNYGQFSEAYFGNKQVLLDHPEMLIQDPVLCFASAIWFWVRDQYPKPSCHSIMVGNWVPNAKDINANRLPGFGAVVNVINGGLECGVNHSENTRYRYGLYQFFCDFLQINIGENAECSTQKPFGQ